MMIAPWTVVFDDHDVDNAWAGDVPEQPDPPFPARRATAFQPFWENMPMRRSQRPKDSEMSLYHTLRWGSLANMHMLGTRQYRDLYACTGKSGTVGDDRTDRFDQNRTVLGADQKAWLSGRLRDSRAVWDLLDQQVFFTNRSGSATPPGTTPASGVCRSNGTSLTHALDTERCLPRPAPLLSP